MGLKEAREARDRAKADIAANRDPSELKQRARQKQRTTTARVFESVARQWLSHRETAWTKQTLAMIEASLVNHVFARIGDTPVDDVEPKAVRAVVKEIEARGPAETAGRVFQRIRAIYRHDIAHDLTATDPTYPLKPAEIFRPRQTRHRAFLPESEMPAFLRTLAAYDGDPRAQMALEFLILTAVRPGELRGIRKDEIDEKRALRRIPRPG